MKHIRDGKYYDKDFNEIHDKDILDFGNGRVERVFLTSDGELGTDATDPLWIRSGKASPGEWGLNLLYEEDLERATIVNESSPKESKILKYKLSFSKDFIGVGEEALAFTVEIDGTKYEKADIDSIAYAIARTYGLYSSKEEIE